MDTSASVLISGAIGAVLGAMITFVWWFSERRQNTVAEAPPAIPPGVEAVLAILPSSTDRKSVV